MIATLHYARQRFRPVGLQFVAGQRLSGSANAKFAKFMSACLPNRQKCCQSLRVPVTAYSGLAPVAAIAT